MADIAPVASAARPYPDQPSGTHPEPGEVANPAAIEAITGALPVSMPDTDDAAADALSRCIWLTPADKPTAYRDDPMFHAEFLRLAVLVRVWVQNGTIA